MYRDRGAWHAIMSRLARAVTLLSERPDRRRRQAVQLFDSWVGCLGPDDYRRTCCRTPRRSIDAHHARRAGDPLRHRQPGPAAATWPRPAGSVIGVDWRIELDDAWRIVGHDRAVQGNLDPAVLLADPTKSAAAPPKSSSKRPAAPATSSTSATASCSRRRSRT